MPQSIMSGREQKAADYRRQAAQCLEVAKHVSLRDRRQSLMQKAQELLAAAEELESPGRVLSPEPM